MTQQQKSPTTTNGHDGKSHENKRTSSLNADDPDEPEEDEILEESPCKRWSKRREKVKQRDVPGIDAAYLAMDNETGNEVVWNEVLFSERKNFREQEEKIRAVFDHLTRLEHPNLVKFHKYWMDTISDKPRIIFITEYMSSGSMSRFLQRARSSGSFLNIKAWKNWTRQILSALSYLHSCDPPIVHANLTCNTVFIQQNGLVKIGCVAPNTIHHHVKTFRENIKNIHYLAPEYDHLTEATTQADIYSFGVCALEMATTGALQNGSIGTGANTSGTVACTSEKSGTNPPENVATTTSVPSGGGGFHVVTEEFLRKAVNSLEDNEQKELIERCLEHDPEKRANVAELLNRLGSPEPERNDEASLDEDGFNENEQQQQQSTTTTTHEPTPTTAIAAPVADRIASPAHEPAPNTETGATAATAVPPAVPHQHTTGNVGNASSHAIEQHQSIQTTTQDRYPSTTTTHTATITSSSSATTTTAPSQPVPAALDSATATTPHVSLLQTPSQIASSTVVQQATAPDEGYHTTQSIVDAPTGTNTPLSTELTTAAAPGAPQHRETRQIVQMHAEMLDGRQLRVQLQLDDQMNRQLTGQLRDEDTPEALVAELIQHGFVSEANSAKMHDLLVTVISEHRRRELEQAARREFGDSTHQNPPPQYSVPTGSTASSCSPGNSSSANQSPKHQSASVPPNS